jgi:hypothetical protein
MAVENVIVTVFKSSCVIDPSTTSPEVKKVVTEG